MIVLFTFLTTVGDEVSGKITGLPDYDMLDNPVATNRTVRLLEGWTGRSLIKIINLETMPDSQQTEIVSAGVRPYPD